MRIAITKTFEVDLTIEDAAKWFSALNDDEQCRFFVEVAKEAKSWETHQSQQWYMVGSHLKNCECSTQEARDLIELIHSGLQTGTH